MTQRLLLPIMILGGVVLIALGSQWNRLRPPSAYWGDEQAAEYTAALVHAHELSHKYENRGDASGSPEFVAAKERFVKINQQLEQARSARSRIRTLLIAAGLISIISAATLYFRRTSAPG